MKESFRNGSQSVHFTDQEFNKIDAQIRAQAWADAKKGAAEAATLPPYKRVEDVPPQFQARRARFTQETGLDPQTNDAAYIHWGMQNPERHYNYAASKRAKDAAETKAKENIREQLTLIEGGRELQIQPDSLPAIAEERVLFQAPLPAEKVAASR